MIKPNFDVLGAAPEPEANPSNQSQGRTITFSSIQFLPINSEDPAWKSKEQAEEARYVREKEQAQLEAIRQQMEEKEKEKSADKGVHPMDRNFEGGFGGQEDLEDRYATTSGEH
ncbi:hypothetical protein NLJ89_g5976 [Agrocybe chaxingu]|uniref:ATPase inhibitor, mitochondrial n=1 Tax=Agrocybe chaxingu TaxID=84603 RepID=A0A9W8MUI4_9AGAR|nr:hypothetical protein NLJ89_g5976 [Agrocybe chaxingu]